MTRPADNTAAQCPVCGALDLDRGAPVCASCGAAMDGAAGFAPRAIGDRVGETFVIDGVRWQWPGVTYYNARLEANPAERVLLAERRVGDVDPLADAGLSKPGETTYLTESPFHTEHSLLSKFDYSGIVKSRGLLVDGDRAYMV